jgi:glycosyltransferase involved in cell wall biosynthesis
MDALDIVVHASLGEPFGLVVVEAMALGKPIVATNVGGPAEIVIDGVSGLLVRPGDADGLAMALRRLLAEPGLARRLSEGARTRAERFSDEIMSSEVATVLNGLVPIR